MHIQVTGQGPDMVLLHGWALEGQVFAPLIERLSAHFTLHVVDLPGHGGSREDRTPLRLPYVVSAIARKTPPAVWCGWSMGGLFALHAAATLPGVRGLVMMAASARLPRDESWPHGVPPAVLDTLEQDLATDFAATLERFLALDISAADGPRAPLQAVRRALLADGPPDPRVYAEGRRLLQQTDLRSALPALRCPSLWIAGRRDRLVPAAAMEASAALAPRTRLVVMPKAGHAPFLGQPDETADTIAAFASSAFCNNAQKGTEDVN